MAHSYKGDYTREISFPLGGIGSGSIGIAGNGALIDWEINNRPNRESINGFSNFAVKAEDENGVIDTRILQGDIVKDFMGGLHTGDHSWGYGHGPNRGGLAGMKHFEDVEFMGEFPFANITFKDKRFPGDITMEAFNPYIPSNDKDSSIPAAFFTINLQNITNEPIRYTVALSVTNPLKSCGLTHFEEHGSTSSLTMSGRTARKSSLRYGNFTLSTDADDVSYQQYWYRGGWFDNLTMFQNDFGTPGKIKNRIYDKPREKGHDTCTLAATVNLQPGESRDIRFIMSWYVPNYWKYWIDSIPTKIPRWKNYYAKLFTSSKNAAHYSIENWDRLRNDTMKFKETLFKSDIPEPVIDAIQGNIAILKSSTCLRLTDGEFYGWEGVNKNRGSCEGTCQHVWNYAYALPFLFPKLERSIRDSEFKYNLEKSGKMHFRLMLPLGNSKMMFRACVDGQMGTVMKCYREWKVSGDTKWLESHWADIKKCIEFAWSKKNPDKWDIDKTGVMHGRQHHTLDVELYGAHSWLTGFYHGALLAGVEMADALGESTKADEYRLLYKKGHEWIEENTFNGSYYEQDIDLTSKDILGKYGSSRSINMKGGYWDNETGQIKYQIGNGCEIDQVVADWHAELMGLPKIFDQEHRRTALKSIYDLNFVSMRDLNNPCRIYSTNGEYGLIICNWENAEDPKKPKIPIPYTQETMNGFEYAAACNMLMCGMEEEALEIVTALRDRYNGKKRNPWAEIECGASYARSMASYSFLLIYSGFKYDMTRNMIGFKPIRNGSYFWSVDGAWGDVEIKGNRVIFKVLYGSLTLREFVHPLINVNKTMLNNEQIEFEIKDGTLIVNLQLKADDVLQIG